MQALILAGGEGTRLRPLTSTVPKPVVPLVDRPFIAFMIDWLRDHDVDDIVMSCGHLASGVRNVLGDGDAFGLRLRYMEEPRPLGTGGALKYAEDLLDERFLMLNGDVLTDIDVSAQIAAHERTGARVTLALYPVDDPSAYGLVRLDPSGAVTEFVEKPAPDQIDTHNISAGVYVLERSVLSLLKAGEPASIERDVFPQLVGDGLYGHVADGYWKDIGTPERYLEATFDILEGSVGTEVAARMGTSYVCIEQGVEAAGRIVPAALVEAGCRIADGARIGGRAVLERGVVVGEGTTIEGAVVMQGTEIGAHCTLRGCIVAGGVRIGDNCVIDGMSVLGEGVTLGASNTVSNGARLFPGVTLPDGALLFLMPVLDHDAIGSIDSTGQLGEVLGLAEHLRDALWRVDSSGARPVDAPGGVIVAGMGGSAAGARLALGALGTRLLRPLAIADGYALPGWAGPGTLVLCSSYSGTTEETLSLYDDAVERGAPRVVATSGGPLGERARRDGVPVIPLPGGFQPRAAIGYLLVSVLEAAALAGAAPSLREEIEAAAVLAEALAAEWGPDSDDGSEAKAMARALHGTVPVIAGAELAAAAAYRWKCQFNENAALPAFASVLPELDHNEVVGWAAAPSLGRFSYVSLEDPGAHPRNRVRAELTADIAADGAMPVVRVSARGESRLERLVSLVLFGDLVSIYAAVLRGADPVDITAIDALKAALAQR